ncbi:hypothetical protein EDC04DRAFT_2903729 [Pisolithus marmoratus]|nr:hypothetical protein EDC04DRAFT_2903729 [Pisolithus marmoratus]
MLGVEVGYSGWRTVDPSKEVLREFYGLALRDKEYAILSHCWGVAENGEKEVSFEELAQMVTMSRRKRDEIRGRTGYMKIIDTCRQAHKDGLEWAWIDTCCIDKRSSSELSEAINSMYQWTTVGALGYTGTGEALFVLLPSGLLGVGHSKELIAPKVVHFFDSKWNRVGDKKQLASDLSKLTRIPVCILERGLNCARPSVAQIISWAA